MIHGVGLAEEENPLLVDKGTKIPGAAVYLHKVLGPHSAGHANVQQSQYPGIYAQYHTQLLTIQVQ